LNYVCAISNIPAKNFILAKIVFVNYVSALLNLPFHQPIVGFNCVSYRFFSFERMIQVLLLTKVIIGHEEFTELSTGSRNIPFHRYGSPLHEYSLK
jgi:hypothetical protein